LALPAAVQAQTGPDSPQALADALNNTNLTWSTSGATNWFSRTNTTHDGISAAQSGAITNSQSSTLQTTITGPGTLSYWWKVSSQTNYDLLQFKVGITTNSTTSGEVNWQQRIVYLGAGTQTLEWVYLKDASSYSGQDAAWLDEVIWVPGVTLPSITVQPVGTNQIAGLGCTLSVAAVGTPTLAYQWQKDGTNVAGATGTNLSLVNPQSGNAGDYRVVITNAYGAVTSQVATVVVVPSAPVVTSHPQSRGVALGQSVALRVAVRGTAPFSYQWQKDGTNLPGAVAAMLSFPGFQASDAGVYQVVVSNAVSVVTSAQAILGVVPVIAWGDNAYGLTNVPVSVTNIVAVAAGGSHSLGLRADGTVVAWGSNGSGQTTVPASAANIVAVAAGGSHSLGLRADGAVVAWGSNGSGQMNVPSSATNIVAVTAGGSHSLGLRADGTVVAWGSNGSGLTTVPASATNIVAVAAGNYHSLGLRADGAVVAWGYNGYGQMNVPSSATNIVAVTAGGSHSLGLRADGTVVAWGSNGYGQMNVPSSATNIVAVAAGNYHSLGLCADVTVVAWGYNNYSQTNVPSSATNIVAVAAGNYHSLGLRADGAVVAWGYNGYGQVSVPPIATNGIAVAGGGYTSLALLAPTFAPHLVLRPAERNAYIGTAVTMIGSASGGMPMQYQWRCNGTNLLDGGRIRGAQTIALTIQSAQLGDAGLFSLVVSNAYGSVTSSVVVLTVAYAPPLAATQQAGPVTQSSATLNGMAVPSGSPTVAWFEWGTNTSYGQVTVPVAVGSNRTVARVSAPIVGLSPRTTYHYSLVVSNQFGMARGTDSLLATGLKVTPWGSPSGGNTVVPPGLTDVVAIAGGSGCSTSAST
jgi:hypothetical protein